MPLNASLRFFCFVFLITLAACSSKKESTENLDKQADDRFSEIISAYTSGKISSRALITIQLAQDVDPKYQKNQKVLSFSPNISGEVRWATSRVIEFVPASPLKNNSAYVASLDLKALGLNVKEGVEEFVFNVETVAQDYDLRIMGQISDEAEPMKRQIIKGELLTADYVDTLQLVKILTAKQIGEELKIDWIFDKNNGTNHQFEISGVTRKEDGVIMTYAVDGNKIGVARRSKGEVEIPGLNDFKVASTKVVREGDVHVLLNFSDPLDERQDLRGLITLEGENELRFSIKDNEVKVYASQVKSGVKRLSIFSGIKNKLGYGMKNNLDINVSFAQTKPQVKLVTKGTILPSTDGLVLPFEAVNLQAVDVMIIKVYEKNVVQFLQTNNLNGNDQLRRVGRPVYEGMVKLDPSGVMNLSKWNRFNLDVSEMIATEPGAIYQVRLNFKKPYSLYDCGEPLSENLELEGNIEADKWDDFSGERAGSYDSYYNYGYNRGYDWKERNNPCHVSYYSGRNRLVSTNILASDLGLIAKMGNDRRLNAYVTDIKTTKPLAGVDIDIYDYQQEIIETLSSDSEGKVELDLIRKPFLLVASRGNERGYLKLWDGRALSLSNFNVGGAKVQRGVQGYIYGERGVWRPGDDIYLDFILADPDKNLPEDHPVVMELIDPSGNIKSRKVETKATNGFYHFPLKTDSDDQTGNWLARTTVGGATFTKRIKIETVKPNRLKIDLRFKKDRISIAENTLQGELNVQWLSGVPAKNLKAEFDLILTPSQTNFEAFPKYTFDDRAKEFSTESQRIFSGTIDQSGQANVNVTLSKQTSAPGKLMATFSGKVFEPGGDFSIDQFSIPFYPYSSFVGIKRPDGDRRGQLLTNKDHELEIVSVDAEGNAINKKGLVLEVFKLNWRWWWDRSNDNLAYYVSRNYSSPYHREEINTVNGKAKVKLTIPNKDWGRYYVRVRDPESGHSAGSITYFDWPGWAEESRPGGAALLNFSTDAEDYDIGEKVKVNIPASTEGRALVSIENGSKVVASYWVETKEGTNTFEFTTTEDMVPNGYVTTTLLQPHLQTKNDLPIRLYGIVPINVSDPDTKLSPKIEMANVLEPESEVSLTVSEANGKPMTYTIAVVDEGLLDITRFKTPDPWNTFFARQALGVKTWDLYEDVIGAFDGDLSKLLALGGDGSAAKPAKAKANRFKPVVVHLGPFELGKAEKANHKFTMPNYIGSVRTMVIAGDQGAYGKTEKATPVRKPLMVLGTMPRVVGPGEKISLPVSIFALEPSINEVEVTVKGNNLLKFGDSSKRTIQFNEIGDQIIDFEFEVAQELGVGKVQIVAQSGREKATYDLEVQVRNPNPELTDVTEMVLQSGEDWAESFDQMGIAGTNAMSLEMSVIPPINLKKRLNYLMAYPHGCIEQTTSAIFPQLFLNEITDLSTEEQQKVLANITDGISRIQKFQTSLGGFAYWPGQSDDNDWGTNYGGHFLLEARDKGYFVPSKLLKDWTTYQRKRARSWSKNGRYNDDLVQAYRLYTLAKAQAPELGAMNRLREDKSLSVSAKWRLAAAYTLVGRSQVAKQMIEGLPRLTAKRNDYYYYGSKLRDDAMVLETLGLLKMQNEGLTLMRSVAEALSEDRWMSTQTTAYALLSIIKFIGGNEMSDGIKATYQIGGAELKDVNTAKSIVLVDADIKAIEKTNFRVENKSQGILFVRVIRRGQPMAGAEQAAAKGLRLKVIYSDRNGNVIDPASLEQGTDFFAEVSIYNTGTKGVYRDLALSQIFPSGWEILNDRLNEIPGANGKANYDYRDIRDDRVYTYFDLRPSEEKKFKVALNATYAGKYYLPTVKVEAMYDDTINGRTAGKWVSVKRSN
ncbi:alpha-2-macroglobulin family protein [Roseivirga sp.]|uniref:alpha-2-macroglobulin family protein n=1 Tax=Roseivirga sp. TaxID=1964215 RepID=UPI003B8AE9E7